jgi:hypothetical protein
VLNQSSCYLPFFTLLSISIAEQKESKIFVVFHVHKTRRNNFGLFLKPIWVFFPWLAGRFHNFELTQNREKSRNGLTTILNM